ncbi:MAG TPA: tetratricopeptide repeat protein [Vicinamibacterales bacterium]|nr:tetratricopeptide repeat protein [Vicinamibacterales bacterium]
MGDVAYEFGPFRLEPDSRRLLCDGHRVPLTPKAVETLLVLVRNPQRVVSKRELIDAVWPSTHVEEIGLIRNISVLRKALGSRSPGGTFIETVPGRGYRFVAGVTAVPSASPRAGEHHPVVAVLPLKRIGGTEGDEYLGLAIADALIARLSALRTLVVRPTNAVRLYGSPRQDPIAAGRALRADWVLDGCLHAQGHRLRATVQLVDVERGAVVWAGTCDEPTADVFALEDSIAGRVAEVVTARLTDDDRLRLAKRHTVSLEAHEWYLKGRYYWNRRTEEGLRRAIECFNAAIAADPRDALAYVGLADAFTLLGTVVYGAFRRRDVWPRARAAAERALDIDPQLAEAHASLAFIAFRHDWDWAAAERGFRRAIELNPHYATARQWFAYFLSTRGRHAEALREIREAQQLDPLSLPIATGAGRLLYFAGRYAEAAAECRKAIEIDATFAAAWLDLGLVYLQLGEFDQAIEALQRAVDLSGGGHIPLVHLGHACAVSGHLERARAIREEVRRLSARLDIAPADLAVLHLGFGETADALACLQRAYDERDGFMVLLKVEPLLAPLRAEPVFQDLLRLLDGPSPP